MKLSLPMLISAAAAIAACNGCAAPVRPELKSPHSHQVPVDFENVTLSLKHGWQLLFPYSAPHCPYYDRRANHDVAAPGPRAQGMPSLPPVSHGTPAEQVPPPSGAPSLQMPNADLPAATK